MPMVEEKLTLVMQRLPLTLSLWIVAKKLTDQER